MSDHLRAYITGAPLTIGAGPHLFLDDYLIEDRWALRRAVNPPYRYPGNPIIYADRPWEERPYRPQVFYDEAIGKYRMYYQCFNGTNYWTGQGPSYYACYAESDDGLTWTKPEWSDAPYNSAAGNFPATNIITVRERGARVQAPFVFTDHRNTDGARRYAMIYNSAGLRLAYSPDGIHWTPARQEPLFHYHSDTSNHVVWNQELGKWALYLRSPMFGAGRHEGPGRRHYRRRTGIALSDDLLNWSVPRMVLHPDELDLPDFDATHVFRYSDQYIGLITTLNQEEGGTNEVTLASSRDGLRWEQPLPRQTWIRRGRPGDFDAGCASAPFAPIVRGWDLWFYYSGFPEPQRVFDQEAAIGLLKLGRDRFLSLEAPEPKGVDADFGYLLTKEFVWHGKRLVLNCRMHHGDERTHGDLRVEITQRPNDADPAGRMGQIVPGHAVDDCDLIRSDCPNQVVRWKGNDDLGFLDGQPIYLRFRIRNGGLFSFTMEKGAE